MAGGVSLVYHFVSFSLIYSIYYSRVMSWMDICLHLFAMAAISCNLDQYQFIGLWIGTYTSHTRIRILHVVYYNLAHCT